MLAIVKEIGIFVVIAQAILYFVPKETYAKYVKVLIGIMIIAKITSPVFSLLSGETWEEIAFQGELLEQELTEQQDIYRGKDSYDNLVTYYSKMLKEENDRGMQKEGRDE